MKKDLPKPLTGGDRQALIEAIPQLQTSAEELWSILNLPDELRVLITDIYGWSILLLKDYLRDCILVDSDQIDRIALQIAGIQAMLRDRDMMIRALEMELWPPPKKSTRECSLARKYRLLREAIEPGFSASARRETLGGVIKNLEADIKKISDDWESQKKQHLESRREKNGYVAPKWTLSFKTLRLSPTRKSAVIRSLMEHLCLNLSQATNALTKLLAGEDITIQLARRAEWFPLRESLRRNRVSADLTATYPTTGTRISAETELTEVIDHEA